LNVLLAFSVSLLLATGITVLADLLNNTVRDPEEISRSLNTEVIGTLPEVKEWHGRAILSSGGSQALVPLSRSRATR